MAVSKVIYDGETLVDLTDDTVTPSALAEGVTAHDASGEKIVGTFIIPVATEEVAGTMKLYSEVGSNTDGTMTQAAITAAMGSGISLTGNQTFSGINTFAAINENVIIYSGSSFYLTDDVSVYLWTPTSSSNRIYASSINPPANTIRLVSLIITASDRDPTIVLNNAGTVVGAMPTISANTTHLINLFFCNNNGSIYCYIVDGGEI